jgi:hypothetical protein
MTHGKFLPKTDKPLNVSSLYYKFGKMNADRYASGEKRMKTKHAAWFVSNCATESARENIVTAIRAQGIQVGQFPLPPALKKL